MKVNMEENGSEVKKDSVNIDRILGELGPVGRYQVYVLVLMSIPNIFSAMFAMNYVFTADDVPYRCLINECESMEESVFESPWAWQFVPNDTRCSRYEPLDSGASGGGECDAADYNTNQTVPCSSWVYGSGETIVAEFDLACKDYKRTLVGTIRNIAVVFALIITGFISDRWGRKTAFTIFVFFASTLGILKSFSVNYEMYISVEFFEAFLGYGFNTAAYVIIVELARPNLRVIFASMTGVAYGLGGAIFGMVAMAVPYWRDLLRTIHAPAILFLLYIFIVDESPRWLYGKGRKLEALEIIRKAARWNKVMLSEAGIKELEAEPATIEATIEGEVPQKNLIMQLLASKVLIGRFVACSLCWIASTFVYYGLSITSVALNGNKYVNYSLSSLMEVIASIFIMMSLERYGRRRCIMIAFGICGLCCIIPYFITNHYVFLVFFFTGKLSITYAFNSVYVYTSELFPTGARNSLLSACSLVGRVGSILAPQAPLLALLLPALPSLLFGGVALLAACVLLLLPETQSTRLPESVLEAERIEDLRVVNPLVTAL